MLESLYLPRVISPSPSPPSPRKRTMVFGRGVSKWVHFITNYGRNVWHSLYLYVSQCFMADSRRDFTFYHGCLAVRAARSSPCHFSLATLLSACQPHPPPFPFHVTLIDFFHQALHCAPLKLWLKSHSYAFSPVSLRWDMAYWHDRSNIKLKNAFWTGKHVICLSSYPFLFVSISSVNRSEHQHGGTTSKANT